MSLEARGIVHIPTLTKRPDGLRPGPVTGQSPADSELNERAQPGQFTQAHMPYSRIGQSWGQCFRRAATRRPPPCATESLAVPDHPGLVPFNSAFVFSCHFACHSEEPLAMAPRHGGRSRAAVLAHAAIEKTKRNDKIRTLMTDLKNESGAGGKRDSISKQSSTILSDEFSAKKGLEMGKAFWMVKKMEELETVMKAIENLPKVNPQNFTRCQTFSLNLLLQEVRIKLVDAVLKSPCCRLG
eukprot:729046-Hanusia_phi.AAC.2